MRNCNLHLHFAGVLVRGACSVALVVLLYHRVLFNLLYNPPTVPYTGKVLPASPYSKSKFALAKQISNAKWPLALPYPALRPFGFGHGLRPSTQHTHEYMLLLINSHAEGAHKGGWRAIKVQACTLQP